MGRKVGTGVTPGGIGDLNVDGATIKTAELNANLVLSPSGTGITSSTRPLQLDAVNDLRFADTDSSHYVAFRSPGTVSSSVTWTLPDADASQNGYALVSNGSGTLSWAAVGPAHDDETASATTYYPVITTTTASGFLTSSRVSSTKLTFQPSTGTLSSTIFNETSSITLKENLRPIEDALDKIVNLSGWVFDRRDGSQKDEAGLVAEEVNEIIPNIVTKDQEGNPSAVAYTRLGAYLVEAIKTLKKEINEIKEKI